MRENLCAGVFTSIHNLIGYEPLTFIQLKVDLQQQYYNEKTANEIGSNTFVYYTQPAEVACIKLFVIRFCTTLSLKKKIFNGQILYKFCMLNTTIFEFIIIDTIVCDTNSIYLLNNERKINYFALPYDLSHPISSSSSIKIIDWRDVCF